MENVNAPMTVTEAYRAEVDKQYWKTRNLLQVVDEYLKIPKTPDLSWSKEVYGKNVVRKVAMISGGLNSSTRLTYIRLSEGDFNRIGLYDEAVDSNLKPAAIDPDEDVNYKFILQYDPTGRNLLSELIHRLQEEVVIKMASNDGVKLTRNQYSENITEWIKYIDIASTEFAPAMQDMTISLGKKDQEEDILKNIADAGMHIPQKRGISKILGSKPHIGNRLRISKSIELVTRGYDVLAQVKSV